MQYCGFCQRNVYSVLCCDLLLCLAGFVITALEEEGDSRVVICLPMCCICVSFYLFDLNLGSGKSLVSTKSNRKSIITISLVVKQTKRHQSH